jgi:hypothetical protein
MVFVQLAWHFARMAGVFSKEICQRKRHTRVGEASTLNLWISFFGIFSGSP